MKSAVDVHRVLLERGVNHEVVRLRRLILSADELPDALGLDRDRCVVARMYEATAAGTTGLVAALVRPGDTPRASTLLEVTGAQEIVAARADRVNDVTEFAANLVCPALLPAGVPVFADAAACTAPVVYTATGDGGTALGISVSDLLTVAGARVGELVRAGSLVGAALDPSYDAVLELPGRSWH